MKKNYTIAFKIFFSFLTLIFFTAEIFAQSSISIISPTNNQIVQTNSILHIKVDAKGSINKVTYWVDNWKWIGESKTAPYSFDWQNNLSVGTHKVRARVSLTNGQSLDAVPVDFLVKIPYIKIEAENSLMTGVHIGTALSGYSGRGYIDPSSFDDTGDKITFSVNISTAGSYPLFINYWGGNLVAQSQSIEVNGTLINNCNASFATNNSFAEKSFGNISLLAGINTISILKCTGNIAIDYIKIEAEELPITPNQDAPGVPSGLRVSSATDNTLTFYFGASSGRNGVVKYELYKDNVFYATFNAPFVDYSNISYQITDLTCATNSNYYILAVDYVGNKSSNSNTINGKTLNCPEPPSYPTLVTKYEAEFAQLSGVTTNNNKSGFSGEGFIEPSSFDSNGDKFTFRVRVDRNGSYPLSIGYGGFNGNKFQSMVVNGVEISACAVELPASTSFNEKRYGKILLTGGMNTIEIVKCYGWTAIDYIKISDLQGDGAQTDTIPPPTPISFIASNITQNGLSLNWAASRNETGFSYSIIVWTQIALPQTEYL